MDLNLRAGNCQIGITPQSYMKILDIDLTDVDTQYLNTEEVAKEIDISIFLSAHGEYNVCSEITLEKFLQNIPEDELKKYCSDNFDWVTE